MNIKDFRRIALSMQGAEEGSHMGAADFRVDGRIFATLAAQKQGYGNLMLTLEQQSAFVEEMPEVFLPIPGGWGRMGMTLLRLDAPEEILRGALLTSYNNVKSRQISRKTTPKSQSTAGQRRKPKPKIAG